MDDGVTLWLDCPLEDKSIIAQRLLEGTMHCTNTGRRVSFVEFAATVAQFIAVIPILPITDAEKIYTSINRDYLNAVCSDENEHRAAKLMRAASDEVCIRGGRAPLFGQF